MPVISTIAAATARAFGAFKAAAGGAADEFFNYVTLLLHGDGTNGAQNNTFLDSSTNNFTITRNGNTTQGTFSPFSQDDGKWGAYFDGSGDYLTATYSAGAMDFTGDFTVECWAYRLGAGTGTFRGIVSISDASDDGFVLQDNRVFLRDINGNDFADINFTMTDNIWTHIAAVRSGSNFSIYLNGTRAGTDASASGTVESTTDTSLYVGQRLSSAGNGYFYGYISNVRIVKGTAVYDPTQTTITVPTTPLTAITNTSLLTCQSNRFKDNSANNFAITVNGNTSIQPFSPFAPSAAYDAATNGGSGYFDGSGDYLTTPTSSQFTAAGDFTVSCWFMLQSFAASYYVVGGNWSAGTSDEWLIQIQNNGAIRFLTSADSTFSSSGVVSLNQWTFFSATRSGSTVTVRVNGTTVRTYTKSDTLGSTTKSINIGQQPGNNWPFLGYITDFRLVSGSAITTIPTSPLTAISGTGLLLNFTNAGILDNTGRNVLETVGNAQISTSVKKFGTGSLAFDGTGDYLTIPNSQNFQFGSGNWTIELWVYLNSTSRQGFVTLANGSGTNVPWELGLNASGKFRLLVQTSGGQIVIDGATSPSTGTWYHIAGVRNGGTATLYLNGVSDASSSSLSTNALAAETNVINVGAYAYGFPLNGYIDDLRITKGVARYTSNFTPPTAAFEDQ